MAATPDLVVHSPNVNDRPVNGVTVIIHATRSGKSMNPTEFEGTLNYMKQAGTVSSHWVIGREGQKARVVEDNRQAWHAGADNDNAWGIEVCQGVESDGFTDLQYDALRDVCRGYMADFGIPAIHCRTSFQPGFVGHQETDQGKSFGKSDPGALFDWNRFIDSLMTEEPEVPTVPQPTLQGALVAMANAGSIMASGTGNLLDLSDADKAALRWVVETAEGK